MDELTHRCAQPLLLKQRPHHGRLVRVGEERKLLRSPHPRLHPGADHLLPGALTQPDGHGPRETQANFPPRLHEAHHTVEG